MYASNAGCKQQDCDKNLWIPFPYNLELDAVRMIMNAM